MPEHRSASEAFRQLCNQLGDLYSPASEASSIARIVFEDALGLKRWNDDVILSDEQSGTLTTITRRLLASEPVQYVLGQADFYGLKFVVNRHVLIPRQETEDLVFWALDSIRTIADSQEQVNIIDIGTGSGCIPITIAKKRPHVKAIGVDIDPEALAVARINAVKNQVNMDFVLLDALEQHSWQFDHVFHLVVSNPPYIPYAEKDLVPPHVDLFEPHLALYVTDQDPLIYYKSISAGAKKILTPGGVLLFECNEFNAPKVAELMENEGFKGVQLKCDFNNKHRMVRGFYLPDLESHHFIK